MKRKMSLILAGLTVAVLCAIAAVVILRHRADMEAARQVERQARLAKAGTQPRSVKSATPLAPKPSMPEATTRSLASLPVQQPSEPRSPTNASPPKETGPALKYNGYDVEDPTARLALYFVGADPDATAYWMSAINDPGLPAEERKDLIEDLNEDGLSDPRHPALADLPLIESRIEIIEAAAPYSMDQVNADAFAEAYKDLVGLLNGRTPR
jgi:hypothetical protein